VDEDGGCQEGGWDGNGGNDPVHSHYSRTLWRNTRPRPGSASVANLPPGAHRSLEPGRLESPHSERSNMRSADCWANGDSLSKPVESDLSGHAAGSQLVQPVELSDA